MTHPHWGCHHHGSMWLDQFDCSYLLALLAQATLGYRLATYTAATNLAVISEVVARTFVFWSLQVSLWIHKWTTAVELYQIMLYGWYLYVYSSQHLERFLDCASLLQSYWLLENRSIAGLIAAFAVVVYKFEACSQILQYSKHLKWTV